MDNRKEAYESIVKILKHSEFSDNLLQQKAKLYKAAGESPAWLYNLVKGVVKYQLNLDYICRQFTDPVKFSKTDLKIRVLLYMGLYQLKYMESVPDHAAINETVALGKELFGDQVGGFVNSVLRSFQRADKIVYPVDIVESIAFEHSYPPNIIKAWISLWGEEQAELLAIHFNETSKLHIRVNTMATTGEKLLSYFAKRNIVCEKSPASPNMLITNNRLEALDEVAFSEGYYSIQDTSAALVVELLNPLPGDVVLDLFAAPGGKCTYIAETMQNRGEVIAVDKTPHKMKLLKQSAERLQISIIDLHTKDAFTYGPIVPAFDKVLVDAPCSGWGVFGRKADLRWQNHQELSALIKLQEHALTYAANFVKPEGYLVYSTCTMNPAENETQVMRFLAKNPNFSLVNPDGLIKSNFVENGFLKTVPTRHETDGAFAAKLQKKGA